MTIWLTIFGMGVVTYLTRVVPLVAPAGNLPVLLQRMLKYVPPTVFAALIVPALVMPKGVLRVGPELVAGLCGGLIAWRTKSMLITLLGGLGIFLALRTLGFS